MNESSCASVVDIRKFDTAKSHDGCRCCSSVDGSPQVLQVPAAIYQHTVDGWKYEYLFSSPIQGMTTHRTTSCLQLQNAMGRSLGPAARHVTAGWRAGRHNHRRSYRAEFIGSRASAQKDAIVSVHASPHATQCISFFYMVRVRTVPHELTAAAPSATAMQFGTGQRKETGSGPMSAANRAHTDGACDIY